MRGPLMSIFVNHLFHAQRVRYDSREESGRLFHDEKSSDFSHPRRSAGCNKNLVTYNPIVTSVEELTLLDFLSNSEFGPRERVRGGRVDTCHI